MLPTMYTQLVLGSSLVRVDIQPRGMAFGRGRGGDRYGDGDKTPLTKNVLGHEIVGSIAEYPMVFAPGMLVVESWRGELAEGLFVPEGNYMFLVRALKVFGNKNKEEDYEVVRTEGFGVSYG